MLNYATMHSSAGNMEKPTEDTKLGPKLEEQLRHALCMSDSKEKQDKGMSNLHECSRC